MAVISLGIFHSPKRKSCWGIKKEFIKLTFNIYSLTPVEIKSKGSRESCDVSLSEVENVIKNLPNNRIDEVYFSFCNSHKGDAVIYYHDKAMMGSDIKALFLRYKKEVLALLPKSKNYDKTVECQQNVARTNLSPG